MRTIKKVSLSKMIADEIKDYIKNQRLQEGDKLPSVESLVKQMNVGRSSLREGLRFLEAIEVIQVINGKGIFVKDANVYRIEAKINIENEKSFLLQMSEVRRALEGKAVELAVERITSEQLEEMEACLDRYQHFLETGKRNEASQADASFHQVLYRASQNVILEGIIHSIRDNLDEFWKNPFGIESIFDNSFPYHVTLLKALKERDQQQAMKEFSKLLDVVEQAIHRVDFEGRVSIPPESRGSN
ncbi:GntR family transcriptional regulator [Kroppenstedtia guangzhouensis]|uniref:GntR family transcriptional regulator n=1 Tax=Kroppenstedtia guangzhouensis TaxID=1274356 RepID=A0ABQ1GIW8_9BACL|nr:FCD domain-containing protein [Kroppenstedtia guangzhouensis]GGA44749.1 GntR family transcriptional regulator [Kroppenstedtia guangzhouensis]